MAKQTDIVGEVSHLRKLAYFRLALPWPFSNREIFLQAAGVVIQEENAAVLTMSSVEGGTWLGHKLKRNTNYVNADIHKAFIYAKMLENNQCQLKMIINADPHIEYIPQRLINWGLKNVIWVYIRYISSKAEKLPEEYKKLIEEKKDYYDELVRRIKQIEGS